MLGEVKGLSFTMLLIGTKDAIHAYEKAVAINPWHAETWADMGGVLIALNRLEVALSVCNKALELNPDEAMAWHNKGFALSGLDRDEEAWMCYEKGEELDIEQMKEDE